MSAMSKALHTRATVLGKLLADNPLLPLVALLGFAASFQTIADLATAHGLPGSPYMYPVGIDVGILALVIESRRAIDDGRSDLVPRLLAWLLSGFTIYVNAHGSPSHDWTGRALHIVMPSLWVAFLELTRWRKLRKRRAAEADRIPRARWLLSPWRTAGMKRRMVLHHVTSYPVACAREEARLAAISLMPAVWGDGWKRTAPPLLRHHLKSGTLPADLALACSAASPGYVPATGELAEEWVTTAKATVAKARATARQQERAIEQAATAPEQRATTAPRKRATRRATTTAEERARRTEMALRLLAENPGMPRKELVAQTGISPRTADRLRSTAAGRPKTLTAVN
jgi:hypothetical protein